MRPEAWVRDEGITQMVGHVGRIDEIGLAGEVGSDLREQVGWKAVKRRLEWIDVTTQRCERRAYVFFYTLQLNAMVRTGRDRFENEDVTCDEPWKEMGNG